MTASSASAEATSTRTPRLPPILPAQMTEAQTAVYLKITGGPRGQGQQAFSLVDDDGALRGPFNAMLLSPAVGGPLQDVGRSVRYDTALTDREREIAILAVGGHWASAFELYAHRALAARVLTETEIEEAVAGQPADGFSQRESGVLATTLALVGSWSLDDAGWDAAQAELGQQLLFELTVLVGYYSTLALQLRVFADEA